MTLTQEQIIKISESLSKIPLDNPQIEKDLNNILEYFELLDEVDTENIKPTYSVISKKNILRKDELKEKAISRKELLDCSNQQVVADQIAVSNIMK
jgi:aspartyl-tRNA(Asn)/glutamyl-tRNA(Gln) amidotransferase subunit C